MIFQCLMSNFQKITNYTYGVAANVKSYDYLVNPTKILRRANLKEEVDNGVQQR